MIGDVWLSNNRVVDIGRWKLHRRIGARLFELADEHLPKRHAQLLHDWSSGASQRLLAWKYRGVVNKGPRGMGIPGILGCIFNKIRKLVDDDLECQLLIAAAGMRTI